MRSGGTTPSLSLRYRPWMTCVKSTAMTLSRSFGVCSQTIQTPSAIVGRRPRNWLLTRDTACLRLCTSDRTHPSSALGCLLRIHRHHAPVLHRHSLHRCHHLVTATPPRARRRRTSRTCRWCKRVSLRFAPHRLHRQHGDSTSCHPHYRLRASGSITGVMWWSMTCLRSPIRWTTAYRTQSSPGDSGEAT